MNHKTPKVSYTNFCRAMAGPFKKHAHDTGAYHTCYIRNAIVLYVDSSPQERAALMEDSSREDLLGFRIASNLLRCGWPQDAIVEYAAQQQEYVDAVEYPGYGFIDVLDRAGYCNADEFMNNGNGLRYEWLADGAPSLHPIIDELEEARRDAWEY